MTKNSFINEKDFVDGFKKIIKKQDKVIVIYSGLWSFIFKIKFKKKNIAKNLLNIIEKFVTKDRTLILPSFSGEIFLREKKFYLDRSLDKNGLLPLEALNTKKYYRTPQPLHSYLILGKETKNIQKLKLFTSWGKTSLFEWLSKKNARICVLGVPWNKGCSYFHRYEELYKVPWRYFKNFQGPMYKNNKKIGNCSEKKYSKFINLKYDLNPIVEEIKKKKLFLKNDNKQFFLESITTKQIDSVCKKFYKKKSWSIVKNKKQTIKWIKNERIKEIIKNL